MWKKWKDKTVEQKLNSCMFWFKIVLIITAVNGFFEIIKLFGTLKMYGLI